MLASPGPGLDGRVQSGGDGLASPPQLAATYWKQQQGYGKAEALLEAKWPERYNAMGHISWAGRLYGNGWTRALGSRAGRIYHGAWGQAPFQSLYDQNPPLLALLPLMPEWWLVIAALALMSLLGLAWTPLLLALPLLLLALAGPVAQAWISTRELPYPPGTERAERARLRAITAGLHLVQPIARLRGRLAHGLSPWRRRGLPSTGLPLPRTMSIWRDEWTAHETWIGEIQRSLAANGAIVRSGGDFDGWDLELRGGLAGSARMVHFAESGVVGRFRIWPRMPVWATAVVLALALIGAIAVSSGAWFAGVVLLIGAVGLACWMMVSAGAATAGFARSIQDIHGSKEP